jgi:hypothetical protein
MFVHAFICYIIVGFSQLKYCSLASNNKQYLKRDDLYISKYKFSNDMKFSRVLDRWNKILQMGEKSLDY